MRAILTALALTLALPMAACGKDASEEARVATIPLTITAAAGQTHKFNVEVARTDATLKGLGHDPDYALERLVDLVARRGALY